MTGVRAFLMAAISFTAVGGCSDSRSNSEDIRSGVEVFKAASMICGSITVNQFDASELRHWQPLAELPGPESRASYNENANYWGLPSKDGIVVLVEHNDSGRTCSVRLYDVDVEGLAEIMDEFLTKQGGPYSKEGMINAPEATAYNYLWKRHPQWVIAMTAIPASEKRVKIIFTSSLSEVGP